MKSRSYSLPSEKTKKFLDDLNLKDKKESRITLMMRPNSISYREMGRPVSIPMSYNQIKDIMQDVDTNSRYLINAAKIGKLTAVRSLLTAGKINIDATDKEGKTALSLAASIGEKDVVNILLEYKADINYSDSMALATAVSYGELSIVNLLLEKKADISTSALYNAAFYDQNSILKVLLDYKADVNQALTENGKTLLMVAASRDKLKCATLLLENTKTDIDLQNTSHYTAEDIAFNSGSEDTLKLIKKVKNYREEFSIYNQQMQAFNFGLDNRSIALGVNDSKEVMRNDLRTLRLFRAKPTYDKNFTKIVGSFLAPKKPF